MSIHLRLPELDTVYPNEVLFTVMTDTNKVGIPAEPGADKIPEDLAVEMRRLAHDLSNALEIIVQTSYLLSTVELKEPAKDWLAMLDSGVSKALDLNIALRTYIKNHTPS